MGTEMWKRGIGIPYPCRFLSKRRWEDARTLDADDAPIPENDDTPIFGEGEGFWIGGCG